MKRFRLIPGLFLVCSLVVVLFSSTPVQAENSSNCFASSVVTFFDAAPDALVLLAEAPVLLSVVSSNAGLTMAETVNSSVSTSVDAEQERWRWFKRAVGWVCRTSARVGGFLSGDEDAEQDMLQGCDDRWS